MQNRIKYNLSYSITFGDTPIRSIGNWISSQMCLLPRQMSIQMEKCLMISKSMKQKYKIMLHQPPNHSSSSVGKAKDINKLTTFDLNYLSNSQIYWNFQYLRSFKSHQYPISKNSLSQASPNKINLCSQKRKNRSSDSKRSNNSKQWTTYKSKNSEVNSLKLQLFLFHSKKQNYNKRQYSKLKQLNPRKSLNDQITIFIPNLSI